MNGLYDHFNALFRQSQTNYLQLEVTRLSQRLPIFENVKIITVTGESVESNVLNPFLSQYPNMDMLWIAPLIHGDSNDESGFFTTQKLHLKNAGTFGIEVLKKFTGRCIDLINLSAFETEFNEFIRKWMKGEICQNLETVNAQLVLHNNLNITDIVDNLETELFDATKRPDSFKFDIE